MTKKYCKKSSLESIADEIRTRAGTNDTMTPAQMKTAVDNLVIPTQQPTSYINLGASNSPYTIPKGIHSGHGTVTVRTQSKTATLSANGSTVYPDSGYVLSSVTVPAKTAFSYIADSTTFQSDSTSFTISGVTFTPKGAIITCTNTNGLGFFDRGKAVEGLCIIVNDNNTTSVDGIIYGSGTRGRITSASMTKSGNNLTINSVLGTAGGSSVSPYFGDKNAEYSYMIWGD